MPTAEKAKAIEQAKEWYQRSKGVVFTDYRGLKVKEMQALRSNLRAKGGELHVIKNTLFRIAAGADTDQLPIEFHNGPTAIAFFFENETECAKVLFDYAKINKSFEVKGALIDGKSLSASEIEAFSKLPSREVLISQIIGLVASPMTNLVSVIEALYAGPIRTIGAVADKVAKDSPAPVAAEPAAPAAPAAEEPAAEAPAEAVAEAAEAPVEAEAEAVATEGAEEEVTSESAPEAAAEPEAPAEDVPPADEAPTEEPKPQE